MTTTTPPPRGSAAARYDRSLQRYALGFPGVVEEAPWGHRAMKVRGRTFLFLAASSDGLSLSMKLPTSGREALLAPFCEATGYGLGKAGWVTARFGVDETPPVADLRAWIAESYRAIAPKRLVAELEAGSRPRPATRKQRPAARRGAKARPAPKRKA